jgi:hypothetical protein
MMYTSYNTTLLYSLKISFHGPFLLHNIRCMRKGCKYEAIFSAVALTEGTQKTTELLEASIQVQCITKDKKKGKPGSRLCISIGGFSLPLLRAPYRL